MTLTSVIASEVSKQISSHFDIGQEVSIRTAKIKDYDYQCDVAFQLSKVLKKPPLSIAEQLAHTLDTTMKGISITSSAPGFINFTIDNAYLSTIGTGQLNSPAQTRKRQKERIVVDYGSPNVAKNMHVGHLRSTVIGDAITRVLTYTGHEVTRQNHLGDWGTQFGMLIEYLEQHELSLDTMSIDSLNDAYRAAKSEFDASEAFAELAKKRVVLLQSGDSATKARWEKLVKVSIKHFQDCYKTLGVLLTEEDIRGESFYNDKLQDLIASLAHQGYLQESQGAKVLFLEGFIDKDKNPLPMILQKSDGGFLYATTDLATLQYRLETLKANRLIYVTDSRQKQHFAMLFAAGRQVGFVKPEHELNHVAFGTILGEDGKPFKTRSGEVIPLDQLIQEAQKRALTLFLDKNPEYNPEEAKAIADTIAIAALKYADLSIDKVKDVKFNWDQMLAFEGNTAPYLLNAVVRIHALFRKNGQASHSSIVIEHEKEHQLLLKLLEFENRCNQVAESLEIHHLCHYLYEVTCAFHGFYEHCPILRTEDPTKSSRINLCKLTQEVLEKGLSLLGIETLERM